MQRPTDNTDSVVAPYVILAILAALIAGYVWVDRQFLDPWRQSIHHFELLARLDSLAARCPNGMSQLQWESAVGWTHNLHCNSLLESQADPATIRRFDEQLAQKMASEVNMDTIHWIWDQYAVMCSPGAAYQRFREVMLEEIETGGVYYDFRTP